MPRYYDLPEYDERCQLQQELRQNVDKTKEKGVTDLKDLVGKNDYEKDRIEYAKRVKQYTTKHKVEALTDHQKEILRQHDEGDLVDFNKRMKEEVMKIQKENQNKGPGGLQL